MNLSDFFRDWSKSYRDRGKYTPVGVTFHWTMAALVIYRLLSGWWMQRYLVGADKLDAYARHSGLGLTLLLLGALLLRALEVAQEGSVPLHLVVFGVEALDCLVIQQRINRL